MDRLTTDEQVQAMMEQSKNDRVFIAGSDVRLLGQDLLKLSADKVRLREENERAKSAMRLALRLCEQVPSDLESAHAELMKAVGCKTPEKFTWPEWSPQANTLRWISDEIKPALEAALNQQGDK